MNYYNIQASQIQNQSTEVLTSRGRYERQKWTHDDCECVPQFQVEETGAPSKYTRNVIGFI
jgi:hypothetical protein